MLLLLRLGLVTGLLVGSGYYALQTWPSGAPDTCSKPDENGEVQCDKTTVDVSSESKVVNDKSETEPSDQLETKDDGKIEEKEGTPPVVPKDSGPLKKEW